MQFFLFLSGVIVGMSLYHFVMLGPVIDCRADRLGLMHYSYLDGGMVANDDFKWLLYYLKNGTMTQ